MAKYVEDQNKLMSRRVRVLIESVEVTTRDDNDYGMDWNLIYKAANSAVSVASPASLVASQVGTTGWGRTSGKLSGSDAVVQALSEIGTVVNRRSFPFTTTSGRPVTQAIRTTFNYVDQVQATAISSSIISTNAQAPTVTQKEETVGTFVTLVPTAKADGTIFLSVSFDVTSAQPLKAFTVGSGDSAVTVQQKTIDGQGVIQEVPVRSGQTVVIGGIESNSNAVTNRRLGANLPMALGGSDQAAPLRAGWCCSLPRSRRRASEASEHGARRRLACLIRSLSEPGTLPVAIFKKKAKSNQDSGRLPLVVAIHEAEPKALAFGVSWRTVASRSSTRSDAVKIARGGGATHLVHSVQQFGYGNVPAETAPAGTRIFAAARVAARQHGGDAIYALKIFPDGNEYWFAVVRGGQPSSIDRVILSDNDMDLIEAARKEIESGLEDDITYAVFTNLEDHDLSDKLAGSPCPTCSWQRLARRTCCSRCPRRAAGSRSP